MVGKIPPSNEPKPSILQPPLPPPPGFKPGIKQASAKKPTSPASQADQVLRNWIKKEFPSAHLTSKQLDQFVQKLKNNMVKMVQAQMKRDKAAREREKKREEQMEGRSW